MTSQPRPPQPEPLSPEQRALLIDAVEGGPLMAPRIPETVDPFGDRISVVQDPPGWVEQSTPDFQNGFRQGWDAAMASRGPLTTWRGVCGHLWDRAVEDTDICPRCLRSTPDQPEPLTADPDANVWEALDGDAWREQLSDDHAPHRGNHIDYACGFSGPHCWQCGEPWPCRTERGVTTGPRAALGGATTPDLDAETPFLKAARQAAEFNAERLARAYERTVQVEDKHEPDFWPMVVTEYDRLWREGDPLARLTPEATEREP